MKQIALSTTLATLAFAFSANSLATTETFSIDNSHSFANWELRHVVARTSGTFHDIKGKVVLDTSNIANSSVEATISIYSLNSSHLRRDVHVLTDEFLDARNHPEMKFVSSSVAPYAADKGTMRGQLTLHGVSKPVTLDYQILGIGADPWGGMRAGFKATTRINRADFGIANKYAANGPVGNEVDITLLIEGIKLGADGQPFNAKKVAEEKAKVISYPMPAAPVVQPAAPVAQPVAQPAPATVQPTPVAPEKKESTQEQLKQKLLKSLFN
ncbi:MAG: polyisoprenoid-binding protein [Hydrogenophilales bacterium CG17_big_fil_post_rev_8_21_14_2_50_63_12]|nr:MAG: polyisoprenoid-binding protein [Hydrogenophilales bacterium CG17_big_fil_post_rev_8_21_14_2_50_63_12]PIX96517.1 MAG: polyisoprenoid-binding protein [Hydrogenophilales bacterium CG_4_10_14_3_um_filter_63_21]PJB02383.1 MAG: polyisoprenoid-binding protein [Hydrogenophilales bacterium CG_4_9_14_3_um_filter_63_34]